MLTLRIREQVIPCRYKLSFPSSGNLLLEWVGVDKNSQSCYFTGWERWWLFTLRIQKYTISRFRICCPILTYYWSGIWIKMTDPAVIPSDEVTECSLYGFKNTLYLAVTHIKTPFITTYYWSGEAWIKIANPATRPPAIGRGCSLRIQKYIIPCRCAW